jgi:hypothetical protein
MLFLNKLGNIKIGGLKNGLPMQYIKIFVTNTSKEGEENFKPFSEDYASGVDYLNVVLPYKKNPLRNFDSGKISFLELNGSIKYYAKIISDNILLFPLQPNMKNPSEPLPVINIGEVKDWEAKLDFKERGILYTQIINSTENFGYLDPVGGNGVFLFKTSSAHSISEIKNTLNLAIGLGEKAMYAPFKFEIHTKIFNGGKSLEEVSYARILAPTPKDILIVTNELRDQEEFLNSINSFEQNMIVSYEDSIKNVLTLEEAAKFFGEKITFKIDNSYGFEVVSNIKESTEEENEINKKVDNLKDNEIIIKSKIPVGVLKSLVSKLIDTNISNIEEEVISIIKREKNIQNIIKYIATINSPTK